MTTNVPRLADLSDADLMLIVQRLAAGERHATAQLIASIAELDARRLYLSEGCSSLFTYCTQVLHLSEHAAYGRIEAARAARRYPLLIERLEGGDITLTAIGLLAPHLTPDNHRQLIEAARHKSQRQVEELVAALHPQPPIVAAVRRLPTQFPPRVAGVISPSAAATQPPTRPPHSPSHLQKRLPPGRRSSSHSTPSVTRCSSRSLGRRSRSCAACRT